MKLLWSGFTRVWMLACLLGGGGVRAAVPPAEQWLPPDTLAVLAVPDWAKLDAERKNVPVYRLWGDPGLRPFREKFVTQLQQEVVQPLERQLGVKLADYAGLLRGQFTLALTQNGWTGTAEPTPALLLLLDAGDQADALKTKLAEVRQKLTESGRKLRTEKIREVEFTTLGVDLDALGQAVGAAGESKETKPAEATPTNPAKPLELTFGQAGSVLLVGTSPKDLERTLARLAGGTVPHLAEVPAFETAHRVLFRDASSFGWIHFSPLAEILAKILPTPPAPAGDGAKPPTPDKILSALGLMGLKSLAFAGRQTPDGASFDLFLGSPEDQRKGLLRLLATEAKEAGPSPWVPADTVQFSRWRMDGQKAWAALEGAMNDISPGMLGFLIAQFESFVKEKEPGFDFRKQVVANLGDDHISYQKAPRSSSLEDLNAPPSITLIASPNAEQLLQALRSAAVLLPPPLGGTDFKEREFLGRKIYTLPLTALGAGEDGKPRETSLHLVASGGYLAFGTDAGLIEEYLRSGENKPKPLAEVAGLAEASQRVGGMATGLFGYQNDAENMRVLIQALRTNADLLAKAFASLPLPFEAEDPEASFKAWLDFSLLPPYEQIAKYFHLTVFAGDVSPQGYRLRFHTPTPPQMR